MRLVKIIIDLCLPSYNMANKEFKTGQGKAKQKTTEEIVEYGLSNHYSEIRNKRNNLLVRQETKVRMQRQDA